MKNLKKHNTISEIKKIVPQDLANLFNVYSKENNTLFYNITRTINFDGLDNISKNLYTDYTIKEGDSWCFISYKFYNTTRLWWIICKFNNVTNPFIFPEVGDTIKILSKDLVNNIINTIRVK